MAGSREGGATDAGRAAATVQDSDGLRINEGDEAEGAVVVTVESRREAIEEPAPETVDVGGAVGEEDRADHSVEVVMMGLVEQLRRWLERKRVFDPGGGPEVEAARGKRRRLCDSKCACMLGGLDK
eukprot:SAG11_NODE_370_length_10058_cov_108.790943_3_plen_126_part_00